MSRDVVSVTGHLTLGGDGEEKTGGKEGRREGGNEGRREGGKEGREERRKGGGRYEESGSSFHTSYTLITYIIFMYNTSNPHTQFGNNIINMLIS